MLQDYGLNFLQFHMFFSEKLALAHPKGSRSSHKRSPGSTPNIFVWSQVPGGGAVVFQRRYVWGMSMSRGGWVCPEGVGISPDMGPRWEGVGTHPSPLPPGHGIQRDTVGKWAVRILLECFLIVHIIVYTPVLSVKLF